MSSYLELTERADERTSGRADAQTSERADVRRVPSGRDPLDAVVYTVDEAARIAGRSPSTIRRLVRAGRLAAQVVRGEHVDEYRIDRAALRAAGLLDGERADARTSERADERTHDLAD